MSTPVPRHGAALLSRETRGAVYVEFLIAFPPVFLMFMGMIQAALLYGADLAVNHAANRAARAAVVVLPDDPRYYGGAPVNVFAGARADAIWTAAAVPLLSIAPSWDQLVGTTRPASELERWRRPPTTQQSVMRSVGGPPAERVSAGMERYNREALTVEVPGGVTPEGEVTVHVRYLFHCGIPGASRLMCDSHPTLGLVKAITVDVTLRNQGASYNYGGGGFLAARGPGAPLATGGLLVRETGS